MLMSVKHRMVHVYTTVATLLAATTARATLDINCREMGGVVKVSCVDANTDRPEESEIRK